MPAGRPPTPTRLKILRGNPGRRAINANEPTPREGAPTMPAWLAGEARSEWKRIVPELRSMRLLTVADRAALAAYCQAWAELVNCTKQLAKEGHTIEWPILDKEGNVIGKTVRKHPLLSAQRDAFARVKAFVAEFGLSPASRSRVKALPSAEAEDPLQKILNRA